MTAAQTARTEGFLDSLSVRGKSLRIHPAGPTVNALLSVQPPDGGEFSISDDTRNATRIAVLRTDLGNTRPITGAVWQDLETGTNYRVTKVEDQPVDIAIHFVCETAPSA